MIHIGHLGDGLLRFKQKLCVYRVKKNCKNFVENTIIQSQKSKEHAKNQKKSEMKTIYSPS